MKSKTNRQLRLMILTALFAAMTFALTFSVRIPMPSGGYIHLGDAMIYLSACILPFPYAIAAAGIGGAQISDIANALNDQSTYYRKIKGGGGSFTRDVAQ